MLRGIDVSAYQHPGGAPIDWAQVKASGIEAVYVEATQGTDAALSNPYLKQDVQGAVSVGLHVGAYHFCYPALNSWQAEAAWFRGRVADLPLDLPPVLDFETPGGLSSQALADWAQAWLGAFPGSMLYSYRSLYATLPGAPWGHPVWMAIPGGTLGGLAGVQYATGAVPGVPTDPDLDYFDPAILGSQPAPTPQEGEMLVVFSATVTAGPSQGVEANFVSNGMFFRWIESPAQLADVLATGQAFGGGQPVKEWGGPVADVGAFGLPADPVTAAMLGLPYGAATASGLTAAEQAQLTALGASLAALTATVDKIQTALAGA